MESKFQKLEAKIKSALWCLRCMSDFTGIQALKDKLDKPIQLLEAALDDIPCRNCDVGTPMEQAHRFHTFCIAHQSAIRGMCDPGCPMVDNCTDMCQCICTWMQMPYEEGENNGRGS